MSTGKKLKELVKEKYGKIALRSKKENKTSCCGSKCGCSTDDFSSMAEDYTKLSGYVAEADLGLGCGVPTEFAHIQPGDTVVDLGSGAGNDAFVVRSIVGESGRVIGIDMTKPMLEKANTNARALGFTNVEFRLGDIETMPIEDNTADVIISNCVMNLVSDKQKAFAETFRILKHGGHFSISDIVLEGELPKGLTKEATLYAGCVSGAEQKERYLSIIKEAGFKNIMVQKERKIDLPDEILNNYLTPEQLVEFKNNPVGIFSISVYAEKPKVAAKRILILCTGNSCRSQMAEGFLKSFDQSLEVFSAGTKAASIVHPKAIIVMKECGIDISKNYPKTVDQFIAESFDYVITVCGNAKERCPIFTGSVKNRIHIGFDDPADATGSEEEVLAVFRKVRDEIKKDLYGFYLEKILKD